MDLNSKIYVAGHRGMVGSSILRVLIKNDYSNLITKSSSELDLTNQDSVESFFSKEKPDYVFLAAAKVGGIQANIKYPAEFLYDNLLINSNVIHSAKKHDVKKLLFLGSSCIYPRECQQPMKEEYLLDGKLEPTNEGYALSKIVGLKLCEYYHKQYNKCFISVMPPNLYGQNDNFHPDHSHVIAALIRKFHFAKLNNDEQVIIWGTGKARREFLYVDDAAESCLFLMKNYNGTEHINVGAGEDISILDLAYLIKEIIDYKGSIQTDPSKPDGMPRKLMDNTRMTNLGWQPKISLKKGIETTYRFFLEADH